MDIAIPGYPTMSLVQNRASAGERRSANNWSAIGPIGYSKKYSYQTERPVLGKLILSISSVRLPAIVNF